jgi:CheY-like chemotaxis protein
MNRRILIIDDETFVRRLLQHTLEELGPAGVEIFFAEDGGAGLARAKELRPHLVLLDVMMPVMNGIDVCRAIRSDPDLAETHVMILTAKGHIPDMPVTEGPHEYLTKPFDPDRLLQRAAAVLGVPLDAGP